MIFTIGHSTHSGEQFLALLEAHRIALVADVRRFPMSRRHPQFNRAELEAFLAGHGIGYRHIPDLGGRRKARPDSVNGAWNNDSFRGYADYMATAPFQAALADLRLAASDARTAVMCAEAAWWQCHRRLLADALYVHGVAVWHILSAAPPMAHELTAFARVDQAKVIYPGLL